MGRPGCSPDDRHVMAKHANIYPLEDELQSVQSLVTSVEKALKTISDVLAELDHPKDAKKEADIKKDPAKNGEQKEGEEKEKPAPRALKGVMRVGVLANGLLLKGNLDVNMVLLCSSKPTRTMMSRITRMLPEHLTTATEEKLSVLQNVSKAALIISNSREHKATCTITLTSAQMREEATAEGVTVKDPPDVLNKQKCLEALAAVRHAKWFQAKANGLQSCVIVIRILRDMCRRIPTWAPLSDWAMELLVEKALGSFRYPLFPGYAIRRVFDTIGCGVILPDGPGLIDPCEKEPVDASGNLTNQEREDITASAQHCVRLISFRQMYKVLGIEPLPSPSRNRFDRKRKKEGEKEENGGEKKEKLDGESTAETTGGEAKAAAAK